MCFRDKTGFEQYFCVARYQHLSPFQSQKSGASTRWQLEISIVVKIQKQGN